MLMARLLLGMGAKQALFYFILPRLFGRENMYEDATDWGWWMSGGGAPEVMQATGESFGF